MPSRIAAPEWSEGMRSNADDGRRPFHEVLEERSDAQRSRRRQVFNDDVRPDQVVPEMVIPTDPVFLPPAPRVMVGHQARKDFQRRRR